MSHVVPALDRAELKRRISEALDAGRQAEAIPYLRAMLAQTPEVAWLWLSLARAASAAGDLDLCAEAAIRCIECGASVEQARDLARALAANSGAEAVRALGLIADLDLVVRPFHARALQDAGSPEALAVWAKVLAEQPFHVEANEYLQLARQTDKTGPRIALVGNCQTYGIADSIRVLWPDARPEALFHKEPGPGYDAVLRQGVDFPGINFTGLQPDLTMHQLKGRFFHWRSTIVIKSWRRGLSEAETLGRFTPDRYARNGYFDAYQRSLAAHESAYLACGMTFRPPEGRFVHVPNHPNIAVLFDIAQALCVRLGADPAMVEAPKDLQALRLMWPIYPEIGEVLGRPGDLRFVTAAGPEIGLEEVIAETFESFDLHKVPRDLMS
jgi:hypothetical protein